MKKVVLVAVLFGVVATLGLGVTLAFAQGPAQPPATGFGPGWMHGGFGGFGLNAEWHNQMQGAVAKALGMTLDELNAQLRAGKTIAQDKKIDLQQLHDDVQAAHKALLQQAVKDGKLTQAQADAMLQRMDAMDKYFDANGGTCPGFAGGAPGAAFAGRGMMGGRFASGGMMGGRGFWTAPTTK